MKLAHTLLAGAALAVSLATAAHAADLLKPADPVYSSPLFNFEGFYVGGTAGGAVSSGTVYGTLGVVVGANFAVTDGIIAGVEFQGDAYYNGGFTAYDALALGRVGGFVADNTMLYGDLGVGSKGGARSMPWAAAPKWRSPTSSAFAATSRVMGSFGAFPIRQGHCRPHLAHELSLPGDRYDPHARRPCSCRAFLRSLVALAVTDTPQPAITMRSKHGKAAAEHCRALGRSVRLLSG